jgi:UDP-glucose:(heptosyl)LPS alpha-1,3-glucosyltransferase
MFHRMNLHKESALISHPNLQKIICNSRMVAEEFRSYYGVEESRLEVIYNGVDTDRFHPGLASAYRSQTRAALGIAEAQPLLLFVGNGFERKGVKSLLEALRHMAHDEAHLLVVGEDRQRLAMMRLSDSWGLQKRVHFTGARSDVERYYAAADAFVLPSIYDPCPNTVLEALACGLPCLVSDRCGAKEWVMEGINGYVTSPTDIDELSLRLDDLCSSAPGMRKAARLSAEHLTLEAMSENLVNLYAKLIDTCPVR